MHGKPAGLCVAVKSQLCFIQTIDSCVWIPYNKTGKMILARFCVRENSLMAISVGLDFYGKLFVRGRLMIFCSLRGINSIEAFQCSQTEECRKLIAVQCMGSPQSFVQPLNRSYALFKRTISRFCCHQGTSQIPLYDPFSFQFSGR